MPNVKVVCSFLWLGNKFTEKTMRVGLLIILNTYKHRYTIYSMHI